MPGAGDAALDETDSARETAPDLSLRDVVVATLGGLILDGLALVGLVLEARVPCTIGRPVAALRVEGSMVVEDGAPLLRGAGRLESRVNEGDDVECVSRGRILARTLLCYARIQLDYSKQ